MPNRKPVIREAQVEDLPAVAAYLAPRMGGRGGERRYRRLFEYDWLANKPNLGFILETEGAVHGFVGAIYARRRIGGRDELFCNISSWYVDERYRNLSLKLMGRLLARPDCTFTCFSPAEQVVEVLKFFKFQRIESSKVICPPISGLSSLLHRPAPEVSFGDSLPARLDDEERRIFQDHRSYHCGHLLLERNGERCYVVTVRRGRGVRAFADVLHASNPELLGSCILWMHLPIGRTHATFLTGIDRRLLRRLPSGSFVYRGFRPLMFRSSSVGPEHLDTLYSELAPMYG